MVARPGSMTEVPIVTAAAEEIKTVLGGKLGATLVESSDPLWKRDAEIEQMKVDHRTALARLVPVFMPDMLFRLTPDGQPVFKEFAAAIVPTEFMPGKIFGCGTMKPIDYMLEHGGRAHRAAVKSRSRHHAASGAANGVPLPYQPVSVAPRRRLEGEGLHRNAGRFRRAQCALEILGRRSARGLPELG